MTESFTALVPEARRFLADLSRNNSRDWFQAHKADYDRMLKRPAEHLLDTVAARIRRTHDITLKPKLLRAQRDVRFSKDKAPYTTHLHLMWAMDGTAAPGLFFGVSPDHFRVGGGAFAFGKDALSVWRDDLTRADGERIATMIAVLSAAGFTPGEPELKRVPAPCPADHPRADLLRRKGLTLWRGPDPAELSDLPALLTATFDRLLPVLRYLNTLP
ncbi:TIGR02453 family protein [Chachezhania sediminis]|uniref:TIGR02453 family protein n=1 Tax=Chachezhania sediminis TaxID=2599291 RepID=UPI00131B869F|nr:TIGR02453 family protein [Chachezhania sediminis]